MDNIQDSVDFADELHADRQSGFSDRATELYESQQGYQNRERMQSMIPYFEVIRNIVIFASRGPKHRITGLGLI